MTAEEFKKIKPEYKNIEGDQLWNAMENYILQQQRFDKIIKQIMPIWKTHTLRWLYYRRIPNLIIGNPRTDKYTSNKRCRECKNGVSARFVWLFTDKDETISSHSVCPHCGKEYHEEENTNITHKIYNYSKWLSKIFWLILDKLHLVRSSISGRYDMFGDESSYVKMWDINSKTGKTKYILRKRRWWEYVLIEKKYKIKNT